MRFSNAVGRIVFPAILFLIGNTTPARAEEDWLQREEFSRQRHLFELGLGVGALFPPGNHGLYGSPLLNGATFVQRPFQTAAFDVTLRAAYLPVPFLGIEVEGALMPTSAADGGGSALLGAFRGHLLAQVPARIAPFVLFGGGLLGVSSDDTNYGTATEWGLHIGTGAKFYLTHRWLLRFDIRDHFNARAPRTSTAGGAGQYWEMLFGASVVLGWTEQTKPVDTDGDGVADEVDKCPKEVGPSPDGCPPDRDKDGVVDSKDKCPDLAGVPPDGCPADRDGDGVLDKDDRCPDQKGSAALKGCPDGDGDGVADVDDSCPKDKGPAALKGCPDQDGDGVPDKDDRCPDVRGMKEHQGCMPEAAKKFSGAIKGITFGHGSAKIDRSSHKLLDEAADLLKQYPSIRLRIEGHSDNVGKPAKNLTLSTARAESVRKYLIDKGVTADRLEAKGFGDAKPVKDNKTANGRAANRRIEFHISAE
jgi:outer membrane protein OmpA-like peptidoglycan-associated protein